MPVSVKHTHKPVGRRTAAYTAPGMPCQIDVVIQPDVLIFIIRRVCNTVFKVSKLRGGLYNIRRALASVAAGKLCRYRRTVPNLVGVNYHVPVCRFTHCNAPAVCSADRVFHSVFSAYFYYGVGFARPYRTAVDADDSACRGCGKYFAVYRTVFDRAEVIRGYTACNIPPVDVGGNANIFYRTCVMTEYPVFAV